MLAARLPIAAADLSQRITLQQRSVGQDSLGQEATTWVDLATVWARAEPLRGREYFAAGQVQTPVDARFTIRHRAGVTPAMRLLHGAQAYDIISVIDVDSAGHTLELMCVTGVGDGRVV
jgi:SPP1 family predicted phage head-tail adaptor